MLKNLLSDAKLLDWINLRTCQHRLCLCFQIVGDELISLPCQLHKINGCQGN